MPDDLKIHSINYIMPGNASNTYQSVFEYDEDGKLVHSKEHFQSSRFKVYDYNNNGDVKLISTYSTLENEEGELISKDSITYTQDGAIDKIFNSWINDAGKVQPSITRNYNYKNDIVEVENDYVNHPGDYITKYHWEGGNITKVERFSSEGELEIEFFYTYDENFNFMSGSPLFITDPFSQAENNVKQFHAKDYTGLYDFICNPCRSFYTYNSQGLPVEVNYEWKNSLEITYK